MSTNFIVYYHDQCMDGFTAAAIVYAYTTAPAFIPVNYRAMPVLEGEEKKDLIFVDFTPPLEWVKENCDKIGSIIILDHHADKEEEAQAIADYHPHTVVRFSKVKSGAGITWDYFFGGEMPEVVRLVSERDLWVASEYERDYHELFALYMKRGDKDEIFPPFIELFDYTVENVQTLLRPKVDVLVQARNININEFILKSSQRLKLLSPEDAALFGKVTINVVYCNAPYFLRNEVASTILDSNPDVDLVANLTVNKRGTGLSFRSPKGTKWAVWAGHQFNGGGHDTASGGVFDYVIGFNELHALLGSKNKMVTYAEILSARVSNIITQSLNAIHNGEQ